LQDNKFGKNRQEKELEEYHKKVRYPGVFYRELQYVLNVFGMLSAYNCSWWFLEGNYLISVSSKYISGSGWNYLRLHCLARG
jgi:hypothetical protein